MYKALVPAESVELLAESAKELVRLIQMLCPHIIMHQERFNIIDERLNDVYKKAIKAKNLVNE